MSLVDIATLTQQVAAKVVRNVDKDYNKVTTVTPEPWGPYPIARLPFDNGGAIVLPAVPGENTVLTFQCPNGYDGVIMYYSLNFSGGGFTQGSGDIVWRVYRNGIAERNFENITTERGSIASPKPIANLQLFSQDIITITVNHAANALLNGQVVVNMSGYFYPNQLTSY